MSDILDGLSEAQYKAVTTTSRACLLLAGPGSGKTHTITARIRYLIHNRGVPPENILVITFTKDAAISMQRRFNESEEGIYPVVFGTFHSVFYQILRTGRDHSPKKLLSDSYKKRIFSKVISSIIPTKRSEKDRLIPGEIAPEFISAASVYKNTDDLKRSKSLIREELSSYFEDVLKAYESVRKKEGYLDFDDMVYDLRNLFIMNPEKAGIWQERFSHILIDEYQDINKVQYDTVKLLAGERAEIFAVGDDDQSIYGFRGSEPACLRRFRDDFNAEEIYLDLNFRSNSDIVDVSTKVITENKDRFVKNQKSARNDPSSKEHFSLIRFEEQKPEYEFIKKLIAGSCENKSLGVLFRTNLQMQRFAAFLKSNDIPFEMKEKQLCIYDHPACIDLMSYLEYADYGKDEEKLYRVINKPLRYISREALGGNSDPLENAIGYYIRNHDEYNADKRVQSLRTLRKDLDFIKERTPYLQVRYIRQKIGLEKYYEMNFKNNKELLEEYKAVLDFMSDDAAEYGNLDDWLLFQEEYRKDFKGSGDIKDTAKSKTKAAANAGKTQIIRSCIPELMTVHASKGLEFDTVIIPDANEGVYPHGRLSGIKETEEERRIFYVAMTRAKNRLLITCITGTKDHPRSPSRFLNNLIDQGEDKSDHIM